MGLVVVSHSRALARAAVDLASEMLQGASVPIEVAAGLDEKTLGTDAVAISEALASADHGDGVVVLMDLGSAVLSAELALELIDPGLRDRVVLCPAPLVEGLVSAVVAAAGGAGTHEVAAEASAALAAKQSHLTGSLRPPASAPATAAITADASAVITVTNPHGLHARPTARLVGVARGFDARVEVRNRSTGSDWVPASSLSRVATIGALRGHEMDVRASGADARAAVDAVVELAGRAFDEEPAPAGQDEEPAPAGQDEEPVPAGQTAPAEDQLAETGADGATLVGRGASPGIGVGAVWRPRAVTPEVPDAAAEAPAVQAPAVEWRRVTEAVDGVRAELAGLRGAVGRAEGGIFEAHLLLLDDEVLLDDVRRNVDDGRSAPRAWVAGTERLAKSFEDLADDYQRARSEDVRAVAAQVLRAMLGVAADDVDGTGILVAADLSPAEAAVLDPHRVTGVLLAGGSPTSHGAILARTKGIPAVVAAGAGVLEIADGTGVALDGGTGEVFVEPSARVRERLRERVAERDRRRAVAAARAAEPAVTRDGTAVAVAVNVGSAADARAAAGADLAGLVRTEFLFLDRDTPPSAEEQEAAYREIGEALGGRRITLRTLDVGGDKPLRYAPGVAESNPFLGVRGIRHSMAHPELLETQLTAIVRVARELPVSVMFPMVTTVGELRWARRMLDRVSGEVAGGPVPGLEVGIMIEVPGAAVRIGSFAPYAGFVSIGTNDLTQYTLAAERGNASLAGLADGLDPGVLGLIATVCRSGIPASVCGELAADEAAVPLLVGLGVRELSVAPPMIPAVKEAVRAVTLSDAETRAAHALTLSDAAAVRSA